MNKTFILLVTCLTFFGCDMQKNNAPSSIETKHLTVIKHKKPKYFKLTAIDENGKEYNYSSKRCSNHEHYKIGVTYQFVLVNDNLTGICSSSELAKIVK